MGRVYRARHLRLNRLVAIKLILGGTLAGMQQLLRFQGEAEVIASLQHPNIVQIHDVGEVEDCPYLSLELVEGGSLDRAIARRPQPPIEAARLVVTLARAIHTAHQRGIIHRDLKPANILLQPIAAGSMESSNHTAATVSVLGAAEFIPKITDFGLAKRLESDSAQTVAGTILGTPSYMAPEQATGDVRAVGVLADVYALGAILYELLTGRPPFQGQSMLETLEQVRAAPPVSPRRLQPAVPRDLETVCLKCLEKDPGLRYPSAEALATDLQRALNHEPLQARPTGSGERLVKWMRRHPASAALVGVVLCTGLLVFGVGFWSYVSLRASAERLDERYRFTRQILNDVYAQAAEEILADEPQSDALRKNFLENLLRFYEEYAREGSDDPAVHREMALAHFRMGQIYRALGRGPEAEAAYGQAIDRQEGLCRRQPNRRAYEQDLANSYNWLGELYRESGRPLAEAEQRYRQALTLQQALHQAHSSDTDYRREMARSLSNLGIVAMDTARAGEARQHFDRAVDLLTELHAEQPGEFEYQHELARSSITRGVLFKDSGQPQQAEADYRRAVRLLSGLKHAAGARAIYKFDLAVARQNLGNLLWATNLPREALAELGEAKEVLTALASDFPARPDYRKKLANTLNSLGTVQAALGQDTLAEQSWQRAITLLQELTAQTPENHSYHQYLGIAQGNLGWLKLRSCAAEGDTCDFPGARAHLEAAIQSLGHVLNRNPQNPEVRQALRNQYRNLAETLVRMQEHARAVVAAQQLAAVSPDQAQDGYYAACFIARSLPLLRRDSQLTESERGAHRERYARLAADVLTTALAGRHRIERLPDEASIFRLLDNDARFTQLIGELDTRMEVKKQ